MRTPGGSPKHASSALAVAVGKTGHSALLTRAGSSPEPRPPRLWPWGLVTFATLVGCLGCVHLKRTPEARFFVLSSVSQSSPAASSGVAPSGVVGLIPVRLPGHLERPQLVSRVSSGELEVHEFFRWAEPLALGIQRVVAENLSSLLHEHRVVRQPWPATTELTCRVGVEISGFDAHEDGHVALVGRYVVLPARGEIPLEARAFRFERRAAVEGRSTQTPEVTVGTQSELLGGVELPTRRGRTAPPGWSLPEGTKRVSRRPTQSGWPLGALAVSASGFRLVASRNEAEPQFSEGSEASSPRPEGNAGASAPRPLGGDEAAPHDEIELPTVPDQPDAHAGLGLPRRAASALAGPTRPLPE